MFIAILAFEALAFECKCTIVILDEISQLTRGTNALFWFAYRLQCLRTNNTT